MVEALLHSMTIPAYLRPLRQRVRERRIALLRALIVFAVCAATIDILHAYAVTYLRMALLSEFGLGHAGWMMRAVGGLAARIGNDSLSYLKAEALRSALLTGPFALLHGAMMILLFFAIALFCFLFAHRRADESVPLGSSLALFLSFLRLVAWAFVQSFVWLPFLGIVIGKYFFREWGDILAYAQVVGCVVCLANVPRTVLSPFYFLEGRSPHESLQCSVDATQGYWWETVTLLASLTLVAILSLICIGNILGFVFATSSLPYLFLFAVARTAVWMACCLCIAEFGKFVMEHPRTQILSE